MALIVGGVTVTGTQVLDATKLSGTIPAISGENLTNLPAASSIPVVSLGVVGSYAGLRTSTAINPGGTIAGSSMRWSDSSEANGGSSGISGTWRLHGYNAGSQGTGDFQRIS